MTTLDYSEVIGRVVRLHREVRGIDLRTMGRAMGLSASGWSRVETGDTQMTVGLLRQAAKKFGLEPWTIVQQADLIVGETSGAGKVAAPNVDRK